MQLRRNLMIDRNAEIQQMIYTAGGRTKLHGNNGSFGVWSKTKGLEGFDVQKVIREITQVLRDGVESNYARQTIKKRVLREGATPSGLFKKTYKDSDYEERTVVLRETITVLQQSKTGAMRGDYEDYRGTPEKAPFRIGATKLADGRLLVVRIGQINIVYSELDNRSGNYFAHSLLFPAGTEIEDIDLNSLDWQYGLEEKYWKGEGVMAPEFLETTSINKMMANKQRKSATSQPQQKSQGGIDRNLSEQELFELYKKSTTEKDFAKKRELKKVFEDHIKRGANLIEIRKLAYMELINAQRSGKDTIDYAIVVEGLENTSCKFDLLFKDFSELSSNTQMGYRESVRLSEQLKDRLSRCDMEVVVKFAESQKEMIDLKRAYERMTSANNRESEYTTKEVDNAHRFVAYCQKVLQSQHQGEMGQ